MLNSAIIVFREVLEAALIISIVLAATQRMKGRYYWIFGGIIAGIVGAFIVAALAEKIAMSFEGFGQELFNAGVLFSATFMLAWHNIWMAKHAKNLVVHLKQVGAKVLDGRLPMSFLAIAVGLAVLREGSEIVLFLYGLAAGGSNSYSLLLGSIIGLLGGLAVGALLYLGLLRISIQKVFSYTSVLILFLASGLAASAAGFLIQADLLPSQDPLWSTTHILAQQSFLGQVLQTLVGYQDQPTPIQLAFYLTTLCLIGGGMYLVGRRS